MGKLSDQKASFDTAPVFLTAISTILGAILFLRFGYAVGHLGFLGTMGVVALAHLVSIPTAMAIAEIATNQKVEGGGEYYIVSRSFGINIGAAIGVALFFSQAISVAFYVIAFAEAFGPVFTFLNDTYDLNITDKRWISIPGLIILSVIMLTRGANLGVKTLYVVVSVLAAALLLFFLGRSGLASEQEGYDVLKTVSDPDSFFTVFAIIFPAFTGMTAGVGLSGNLKDPKKSLPKGTLLATFCGMIMYVIIGYKLSVSASVDELANNQMVMADIALWGPIIPIGLAAATISSALGSVMVAPRTLQALAADKIIPSGKFNYILSRETKGGDPLNATVVTVIVALIFVSIGSVNAVAKIISMFFMVTYGAICLISFLQHFAADPSYRPAFRSRWYISLIGALMCVYLMFRMNPLYAFISIVLMTFIYIGIRRYKQDNQGMAKIFQGAIFQLSRQLQVFLQKADKEAVRTWRPSVICISQDSFQRTSAFDLMRWISHRYGFGTYLHFIKGYVSRETHNEANELLERLIAKAEITKSNVYLDTIISPSYTTAVAQSIQLPSVSGKESNMFLFEFSRDTEDPPTEIIENVHLVKAASFDICILSSCEKGFGYHKEIHIWITTGDFENASLMILMGFVIMGHSDWRKAEIKIFAICPKNEMSEQRENLLELIDEGRLPISPHNLELIEKEEQAKSRDIINEQSVDADLVIVGFKTEAIKQMGPEMFEGLNDVGNVLFVNSNKEKEIT